jgi:Domain of unknown function (DUF5753)
MQEQPAYLTEAARRPHIVVHVAAFTADAHEEMKGGAFVIAELADGTAIAYQVSQWSFLSLIARQTAATSPCAKASEPKISTLVCVY